MGKNVVIKFLAVQCKLDGTPEKILGKTDTEKEAKALFPKEPFPGFNYSIYKEKNGELVGVKEFIPTVRTDPRFF